jgi:AraC-like DNA-binding protein
LWYTSFTIICADYEGGMFTPEELRQAKIFACLDEAECARLAHTIADVRLEPGEWLFREGAPAAFYVLFEGRLRMVLDVHGKQTEFPEYELKHGEFLGEVPLLLLIFSNATVESAALDVGYASVSQFSREYTRVFGTSPRREVSTWRRSRPMA